MELPRSCINCKHLSWQQSEPDYSEYTPGSAAQLSCDRGLFLLDTDYAEKKDFRLNLNKALTCKHYEEEPLPLTPEEEERVRLDAEIRRQEKQNPAAQERLKKDIMQSMFGKRRKQ